MDVDRVLTDALVDAPVRIGAGPGPPDHLAVLDGEDEWLAIFGPAFDVVDRARRGLECGHALGMPAV